MKSIAQWFFATAALFAILGMVWGIQMSITQDHTLSPAHGHLNLLGFVVMAVFGTYYALTPQAAGSRLAAVHYWLMTATVVIMAPGIAMAISGQGEGLAKLGSILALVSMVLFAVMVLRHGVGAPASQAGTGHAAKRQPAE